MPKTTVVQTERVTNSITAEPLFDDTIVIEEDGIQADMPFENTEFVAESDELPQFAIVAEVIEVEPIEATEEELELEEVRRTGQNKKRNNKIRQITEKLAGQTKVQLVVKPEHEKQKMLTFSYSGVKIETPVGRLVKLPYDIYKYLVQIGKTEPQSARDMKDVPQQNKRTQLHMAIGGKL